MKTYANPGGRAFAILRRLRLDCPDLAACAGAMPMRRIGTIGLRRLIVASAVLTFIW
jgi:hypothetical protein